MMNNAARQSREGSPSTIGLSSSGVHFSEIASALAGTIPANRLITDELRRLAYGTDASFYRLVPGLVVIVESEGEVIDVLRVTRERGVPVTFRAAGTSLSGQAITDSVLIVLGDHWDKIDISEDAETVVLGPGVIGGRANQALAPLGRKIGPDPASINACKIGGIANNNASGMCCGTAQNSYQTVVGMRLVMGNGTVLDTRDEQSRLDFTKSHGDLLDGLKQLADSTQKNTTLADRIRHKFKIKNTTGYSLNALVDYQDPFDVLEHLVIGSEGTLAFLSEITYRTVPDHANKATALLLFETVEKACEAVTALKPTPVTAVELIDRKGMTSVQDMPGMPKRIKELGPEATALLVETRGEDAAVLQANTDAVLTVLADHETLQAPDFTTDPVEYDKLWKVRKGLFPAVGAMRETGTTVIIEDVAFPIEHLAAATRELQSLFQKHSYDEALIFGHALEGNLHFVFTQDFATDVEVTRYSDFMDDVAKLVVGRYDGSLKAEHGTGRNMAPFVEMEWGTEAYALMKDIKALFDKDSLINPGVILNDDAAAHVKNLKPLPAADAVVDKCIECGFCEPLCPSAGMTFTPRQRITSWREISRRERAGEDSIAFKKAYAYQGLDTCAACGLCATACPVGIDTGSLTKTLRGRGRGGFAKSIGSLAANNYGLAMGATKLSLSAAGLVQKIIGSGNVEAIGKALHKASAGALPLWMKSMPTGATFDATPSQGEGKSVVYIPSCAARAMGPAVGDPETDSLPTVMHRLMEKAGFSVIYPDNLGGLCCGQPFDSKGLTDQAKAKASEMEAAIAKASNNGEHLIVMDTSPCSFRMQNHVAERLNILDITPFLHDEVLPRLAITGQEKAVALHVTCSTTKMALEPKLTNIAKAFAETVHRPMGVTCCGFAGDKGFTTPELNDHALRNINEDIPETVTEGFSTSRTCEIGASLHGGRFYRSIAYLMDRHSETKTR